MFKTNSFFRVLDAALPNGSNRFLRLSVLRIVSSIFELIGLAFLISVLSLALDPSQMAGKVGPIQDWTNRKITSNEILLWTSLLCFLAFLIKNGIGYFAQKRSIDFAEKVTGGLGEQIAQAFLRKGYLYLRNQKIFKITHRTSGLSFEFATVAVKYGLVLISEAAILIIFILSALFVSPKLTILLLLLFIPIVAVVYLRLKNKAETQGKIKNELTPSNNRSLAKLYESYLEMKIYGLENEFVNRYRRNLGTFNRIRFDQQRLGILPKRLLEVVAVALILGMFIFNQMVMGHTFLMNLGIIGIFAYKIMPGLSSMVDALLVLRSTANTRSELLENLSFPSNEDKNKVTTAIGFTSSITMENVAIGYNTPILRDVNISLQKGSIIGIKGKTGAGKSTLIKVIMGLLEPLEGQIMVDGRPVHILENDQWLKVFGYVGPDSTIMDGSVYQNVSFSSGNSLDKKAIEFALKQAQLDEFVGSDRILTEEGRDLSSGQKQRLALARALYHKPGIIVLDEFSSHLDHETEKDILKNIKWLNQEMGQTFVIISHRPAPLEIASKVISIQGEWLRED